jgi:hypothetical protein
MVNRIMRAHNSNRRLLVHRFYEPFLNGPRQIFLPSKLNMCVIVGHIHAGVPRDLAGLNSARSYFLPPSDVGAPQRVQAKPQKVAASIRRGNLQRFPYTRVPHWTSRIGFLRKHPLTGFGDVVLLHPRFVAPGQRSQCEYATAVLGLRHVHIASAMTLLNVESSFRGIDVLHSQAEHLRDARAGRQARFADQQLRVREPRENSDCVFFAEYLFRSHHPIVGRALLVWWDWRSHRAAPPIPGLC